MRHGGHEAAGSAGAGEPSFSFVRAWVFDAPAHRERACERALGERRLVVGEVGFAPHLRGVRFTPRVLAIRMRREIEGLTRGLNRFRRIGPREPDSRQRDEQLDAEQALPA